MSIMKRLYLYIISLVALGIFTAGGQTLLRLFFDLIKGTGQIAIEAPSFRTEQLSRGLAMLVIGGVLWFLFWRSIQKQSIGNPAETGSALRKLFLSIVLAVSALAGLNSAAELFNWLLGGVGQERFSPGALATLLVAAGVWYYHWRVGEQEGQPSPAAKTLRRWYVYFLSIWSLVTLSVWLVMLTNQAILGLPIWGETITSFRFWSGGFSRSIGWVLVGGASWVFHWFRMARADYESILRQVYLYLLAIPGSAIAALVASTTSLYRIIRFIFGSLDVSAGVHFQFLGWTIPTILVGTAIWGFHRRVAHEEADRSTEQRLSARRIHFYIMSFIGLGTMIAGLIILFGVLLELLAHTIDREAIAVSAGWWHQQLSLCLALVLVGLPTWLYYWNAVLRIVTENNEAERAARSRRIFLYVIVGITIITLAADLVNIVYQLLNGLLQVKPGAEVYRSMKWSLQTLIIAIPVLLYHWQVLRQDQRLGAEKLQLQKRVTILAGEASQDLVSLIEKRLGYRVRRLHHVGQAVEEISTLSDEEANQLVNDITTVPGDRVMVILARSKVMVLPYQER